MILNDRIRQGKFGQARKHWMNTAFRFSADTVTIAEDDAISVLNRRGIVTIRSKNIGYLHRALLPHIDGHQDEAGLLALLPQHLHSVARDYLRQLEEAKAIVRGDAHSTDADFIDRPGSLSAAALGRGERPLYQVAGTSSFVSLQGPVREKKGQGVRHVCFVSRKQAANELLWAGRRRHEMIYVEASRRTRHGRPTPPELEERAEYARWLLGLREPSLTPRACFYDWDANEGSLRKLVNVASDDEAEISKIPRQIDLITMVDVNQRPLVCLRASHRLFPIAISRFGVRYESLSEELVREFIARTLLSRNRPLTLMQVRTTISGQRMSETVPIPAGDVLSWAVALSQLAVRAQALELHAQHRSGKALNGEIVDVLRVSSSHSEVAYLQRVLRLRLSALTAQWGTTEAGYFFFESSGHVGFSLIREKALRDLLLRLMWKTYYGSSAEAQPQLACDYSSFVPPSVLGRLVRAKEAALSQCGVFTFLSSHVRAWGRGVWVGRVGNG